MRLLAPLALFFATLLPVWAQTAAPSAPRPSGMKLLPDTAKGHFAAPLEGNAFSEGQQRKLMLITFDKAAAGQTLNFSVRARSTTASAPAVVFQADAKINEDGLVPLQVRLPRNWPVGGYDVLVAQNGQPVVALPYRVMAESPRVTPLTFGDIAIDRVLEAGKVEPANPVRSTDRHLNFAVKANGANTNGVNLTWVFTAVDTTSGAREVNRVDDPNRPVENTLLQFDISLPRDWPLGRYRVDLFVDGRPAVTRGFTIEK